MSIICKNNVAGHYVYAYLRDKDSDRGKAGTPYYIGKGTGNRYQEGNKARKAKIPRERWRIVILESKLSHLGAIALERRLIKWWGRLDIGTGCLYNRTDGGDGGHGRIYKPTLVAIEKNRIAHLGRKLSPETIIRRETTRRLKGSNKQTAESINKMLKSKEGNIGWTNGIINKRCKELPGPGWYRGYTASKEERTKRSLSHKGKSHPQIYIKCVGCGKSTTKTNIMRWHSSCITDIQIKHNTLQ